jgi:hypothetical protein
MGFVGARAPFLRDNDDVAASGFGCGSDILWLAAGPSFDWQTSPAPPPLHPTPACRQLGGGWLLRPGPAPVQLADRPRPPTVTSNPCPQAVGWRMASAARAGPSSNWQTGPAPTVAPNPCVQAIRQLGGDIGQMAR